MFFRGCLHNGGNYESVIEQPGLSNQAKVFDMGCLQSVCVACCKHLPIKMQSALQNTCMSHLHDTDVEAKVQRYGYAQEAQ